MATVNIMKNKRTQSRAGLAFILSYCKRDSKTIHEGKKLVSGVNCVPESTYHEFMNTKMQYGKTDGRMFYHFTQSFHPDEKLTPETAHEIALKFAQQMFPGFEVLVATHTDKAHIHSHFVVNSVSCDTGYKYHSDSDNIQRLRDASDKLCMEYGLSVVTPKDKSQKVKQMSAREYHSAERGESWKMQLIVTIEDAMAIARSREHFIRLMEAEGYEVKWTRDRKSITYTTPDGKRCRDNKLYEEKFLKENMEYEFRIRREIERGFEGYSESADQESGNLRPLYGDHGCELEGVDRGDEYAGRYAFGDTGFADQADNERGTHLVYGSADRDTDRVRREQSGADRTVHGDDGADGDGIYRTDEYGSREFILTGWENERAILTESLFGAGNGESVYEAEYLDLADSDSGADRLGIDSAYLFADLTNIIDEDAPVEDCTTMHQPRRQKKNTGPVMGGM
jgi:hypothetical protein